MILYLFKSSLLLALGLLVYKIVLEHTKVHVFKRFYLLGILVISITLPLFSFIDLSQKASDSDLQIMLLPEVIINQQITPAWQNYYTNNISLLWSIYLLGAFLSLVYFIYNLLAYKKLNKSATIVYKNAYRFAFTPLTQQVFSFYKTIYCPMSLSLENDKEIVFHEMIHIKQRHSLDILMQQSLQVLFWFNPLIYLYKAPMMLNHEFLADTPFTLENNTKKKYLEILLENTIVNNNLALSSPFNFNQTKKRFIMITRPNNKKHNFLGLVLGFSVMLLGGSYTLMAQEKITVSQAKDTDPVYDAVEVQAKYPGGMSAFNEFFIAHFKIPETDLESFRVILQFTIEKDGSMNNFVVLGKEVPGLPGVGDQAIEVLEQMPNWIPAYDKGEPVRSRFTLPITIKTK